MIFYFYKFATPVDRIINFIKTQYDYLIFIKSRSPVFFFSSSLLIQYFYPYTFLYLSELDASSCI